MRTNLLYVPLLIVGFVAGAAHAAGTGGEDEESGPCWAVDDAGDPAADQEPAPSSDADKWKPPTLPRLFLQDIAHVMTGPLHWKKKDWIFAGSAVVGVGFIAIFDKSVTRELTKSNNTFADDVAKVVEPLGAEGAIGVIAIFGGVGYLAHDTKAKNYAFDALAAVAIADGIIVNVLKEVVGRGRPEKGAGPFSFTPGRAASFPSGHTATAFALASVLSSTYEKPWVTATGYGLAALVGFARIRHSAHFASDVATGAVIGTAVGLSVVHFNKRQRANPENTPERVILSAAPSPNGRGQSLVLAFRF